MAMPLPTTIVKTRVTHTYYDAVGEPASGMVIFTPDPASLASQGIVITPTQIRMNLDSEGKYIVDLPTGVEDGSTLGVIYEYSVLLNGGTYSTRNFLIPVSSSTIDIETLVPITPSPEAGRFVFPSRDGRPTNPRPGEAFNNIATGDTEYWNSVTGQWIGLTLTSGAPPVGAAGGSLAGTYPNPTLANNSVGTSQIQNASVSAAKLTIEYVPKISYLADLEQTGIALGDLQEQIDEKLDITATAPVLVLEAGDPVPPGTLAGTVILRLA